jgi:hypothetical protein
VSADPLLADAGQRSELRIFVHQHGSFLLSGGGDPRIRYGQGMAGLDGGSLLQESSSVSFSAGSSSASTSIWPEIRRGRSRSRVRPG